VHCARTGKYTQIACHRGARPYRHRRRRRAGPVPQCRYARRLASYDTYLIRTPTVQLQTPHGL